MNTFSRRNFLAGVAALGLGTATLAGCTSNSNDSSGHTSGDTASDASSSQNVLRVGALGKAASAVRDPYQLLPNDSDMLIASLIWEAMTIPGSDEVVAPRLMESWFQISPTEWEFTIADGATFHDGSSVTSKDVVWSLQKLLADEANAWRLPVIPDSISAAGESAVRMKTEKPNSQIPLASRLQTFIMKKGSTPEDAVGSGPFQLVAWDNGAAKLKRFDDYHGTVAGVEEIHVIPFEDTTAMTNALISGQIDVAQAVGPVAARSAESKPNVQVVRRPNDSVVPLIMRTSDGPFADPRAREAIRLGVDREQLVDRALSGYGSVANDILGTGDPNLDTSLVRSRDVNRAKKLLEEAKFDTSATYDLYVTPEAPNQVEAMKIAAEQLHDIGVKVRVVEQDSGEFYDNTWTKADLYCGFWGTNDSTIFFDGKVLNGESSANESNFQDEEFDRIYGELLATTDTSTIDALSRDLQRIQFERGGYVVWGAADGVDLAAEDISGLPTAPGYGRVALETVKKG